MQLIDCGSRTGFDGSLRSRLRGAVQVEEPALDLDRLETKIIRNGGYLVWAICGSVCELVILGKTGIEYQSQVECLVLRLAKNPWLVGVQIENLRLVQD